MVGDSQKVLVRHLLHLGRLSINHFIIFVIITMTTTMTINITRPKLPYVRQGLAGGIVGQGYNQVGTFWGVLNIV